MCWILRRMLQWTWIKTMLIFKLPMDHTCPLISCFLVVKLEWCDSVISSPTKLLNILQFPSPTNLFFFTGKFSSVQFSCSVMSDSLRPHELQHAGLPVHHQLPEFTQTYIHWVGDAIQPSYPLSSPSLPAPNPSQHQSLFQWVNSSHEVAKVLEFQP